MKASDVMVRDIAMVTPSTPLREAARTMLERRISGLPVVGESGHLLGMVTEGDLLHRHENGTERHRSWWLEAFSDSAGLADDFVRSHGTKVADVMTRKVHSVTEETDLAEVAAVLDRHRLKRVPVVADGKLVGIISRADLLRAFLTASGSHPAASAGDPDLRQQVDDVIVREPWATGCLINVAVDAGTVRLGGIMSTAEQKRALQIAVEEIPGVKQVQNDVIVRQQIYGY